MNIFTWRLSLAACATICFSVLAVATWHGDITWQLTTRTTTTTTTNTRTRTTTTATTHTTLTSTTITTSTSPLPDEFEPIFASNHTKEAALKWLALWRNSYVASNGTVPELPDAALPEAFQGVQPKVVISTGGAAGGVVTEGMGYALLIEGLHASRGDEAALQHGLAIMRSWLGMVHGPATRKGSHSVNHAPYGEAIIDSAENFSESGVATWKFPPELCQDSNDTGRTGLCSGSATDGDQDAIFGMVYLAGALGYPEDFLDVVMRALIAFASADLGFPDLYRTLDDGTRLYLPKGGSDWGGIMPSGGRWATSQDPWCYEPGYFSPGTYRVFRDFVARHWAPKYSGYLPSYLDGTPTSMSDLFDAFNGAIIAGYNVLYYSSCESGAVSNWVGVHAPCENNTTLSCPGVPWAQTPYVGDNGTCSASGTKFGSYGADASRTPWRIALDYILYTSEATDVPLYDRDGKATNSTAFNAKVYLNRISRQYKRYAHCDGATYNSCLGNQGRSPYLLSSAFMGNHWELESHNVICHNVPNKPESWWADFMAWPTFTAFVAPLENLPRAANTKWLDTFGDICRFQLNETSNESEPVGALCSTNYFEASQEVIAMMLMSGHIERPQEFQDARENASYTHNKTASTDLTVQVRMLAKPRFLQNPMSRTKMSQTISDVSEAFNSIQTDRGEQGSSLPMVFALGAAISLFFMLVEIGNQRRVAHSEYRCVVHRRVIIDLDSDVCMQSGVGSSPLSTQLVE